MARLLIQVWCGVRCLVSGFRCLVSGVWASGDLAAQATWSASIGRHAARCFSRGRPLVWTGDLNFCLRPDDVTHPRWFREQYWGTQASSGNPASAGKPPSRFQSSVGAGVAKVVMHLYAFARWILSQYKRSVVCIVIHSYISSLIMV